MKLTIKKVSTTSPKYYPKTQIETEKKFGSGPAHLNLATALPTSI